MYLDLKDKIIELQKTQKSLKESIIETDVCLKSLHMNYRQEILKKSYQTQKANFSSFCQQFKNLSTQQRRPYETMFRKFKQKVDEHQEEIRLVIQQPTEHKKKLQSIRQVWFQDQEREEEEWKFLLRGFIGLFGAFLCHVLIGAINRWSLINPYITSFYKITTDPHLEIKKNGFMMPLNMLSIGLTMKWGFHQCKEYGPIKIMIISVLGMALSIWMASFVDEFIQFFLLNNVLYGLFGGMIFLTVMRQCHAYFPKYRLVCNSIILMGTGCGVFLFGILNTSCMNPNHEKPLDTGFYVGDRDHIPRHFPVCWRAMSVVVTVIGIIAIACFYPLLAYNRRQQEIKLQKGYVPDFENSCYTDEEALKSKVFWVLAVLIMFCSLGNFYMTANYKNYVKAQKDPIFKNQDYMLSVLLTGFMCGAFFRVFWGLLFKNFGFKYTFITALCLDITVYSLLVSIQLNQVTYITLFATHFIVQGGYMVIFSNVCLLVFGDIIGQSVYGFYWAFFALTSFIQYLLGINITDVANFAKTINSSWSPQNSYKIVLYPAIVLAFIAIIITSVTKFQGRWQNSLKLLTFKCQEN